MRMHQVGIVIMLNSHENPCTWGISRFLEAFDSKKCNGCSLYITCFASSFHSFSLFLSDNKSSRLHVKSMCTIVLECVKTCNKNGRFDQTGTSANDII